MAWECFVFRHEFGGNTVVILGESPFRKLQLQFRKNLGRAPNGVSMLADAPCHFEEDAVNLGEFFVHQTDEFVVLLDGFKRLDEDGLTARAGAVDDALHATFLLDLDGNDEAFAADRD